MTTFEEFLREEHAETYMGTDDDMPNKFDDWVSELPVDILIRFADDYSITLLEKQREEIVEMIKNHVTQIDGNKDEVLSAMYTAEKLKQDIIDKIKSHDKTS